MWLDWTDSIFSNWSFSPIVCFVFQALSSQVAFEPKVSKMKKILANILEFSSLVDNSKLKECETPLDISFACVNIIM